MPQAASQGLWPGEEGLCACVGGCSRWGAAVCICLCTGLCVYDSVCMGCVCVPTCTCKTSLLCVPEPCAPQRMDGQARPLWAAYGAAEGPAVQVLVSSPSLPLAPPTAVTGIVPAPPPASWVEWVRRHSAALCSRAHTGGRRFLGMVLLSLPGLGRGGGHPFLWGGTWPALVESSLEK